MIFLLMVTFRNTFLQQVIFLKRMSAAGNVVKISFFPFLVAIILSANKCSLLVQQLIQFIKEYLFCAVHSKLKFFSFWLIRMYELQEVINFGNFCFRFIERGIIDEAIKLSTTTTKINESFIEKLCYFRNKAFTDI